MATEQERINFCKMAAKLGCTPSELVQAYKHNFGGMNKESFWLADILGSTVKMIPEAAKYLTTAPLHILGLAATVGAAGGAGLASLKGVARSEYPNLFVGEDSSSSPELKEEKRRQLIARYQNAAAKLKEMRIYERDVQNPTDSDMMRYEFGGFGDE